MCFAVPAFAGSATEEAAFEHAVSRYEEADFAGAVVELQALDRTMDRDLLSRTKLYVAMCYLGLADKPKAKAAIDALLDLEPDFNLPPFSSPVVRGFFDETKAQHVVVPLLEHAPPLEVESLAGMTFVVTAKRMRPGYTMKLKYRLAANAPFSELDIAERGTPGRFEARLPGAFIDVETSKVLQYFFVVDAPSGPLAYLRSEKSPFEVPVIPPKQVAKEPVHKQWWFWTALIGGAAVVAGVATGAAVYVKSRSPSDATATVRF